MKLLALVALVAAADEKKKEVKAGAKCVMGKDECNYEADQKMICIQADWSGFKADDAVKKLMKDKFKVEEAAMDKAIEKVVEDQKKANEGDNGVCGKSGECDTPSADTKAWVDAGASYTCSAKALAVTMGAVVGALA